MATRFRPLVPFIYHEKQQEGSMLCAQHALNSLLQGNYYTAPDLSDLARSLDDLEETHRYENAANNSSNNMDDTGFFSIQVIENALKVWGLNLVRWRSEEMRPYQDNPQSQLAFILNLEQHWFTLRRFGHAEPNIEADEGNGQWFNLNSALPGPEWVGKEYLKMVLQQSEADGYSVFVVTQADPEAPLALPRTQADVMASSMSESGSVEGAHTGDPGGMDVDLGDEDYELQAALQASLMASSSSPEAPALFDRPEPQAAPQFPGIFASDPAPSSSTPQVDDPVQASMERNRLLLERMKREQEFAQRELWSETDLSPEETTALQERRERRRHQEEEEERELRLAIEASERLAVDGGTPPQQIETTHHEEDDPELQAALRASLQAMDSVPVENTVHSPTADANTSSEDDDSDAEDEPVSTIPEKRPSEPSVSVDEMRRKRLERFGM